MRQAPFRMDSSINIAFAGNVVLCLALIASAYTFAVSLAASRRPHLLSAARLGTYATCGLVAVAVLVLAFAFQVHDFGLRYVSRYSDRSMAWWYLVAALWGGQDGSLLWWSFLLCGYTTACTLWLRHRLRALQPFVLATLMSILIFFLVLMLFAANPFAAYPAGAPLDGEGLNPLLQNYWMTIHPPSLYMGFVGWSVPFAFVIAALLSGRLDDQWIHAARNWTLIAWLFLSIGLLLGMFWSYEELGWGGYWAWDPVENASFLPWLVGTAYLHSVMVQERLGMLKVWNVFLLCLTFIMTIFGTFLTRAGLISSVHSFARSDIGVYFAWYLVFLVVACAVLIVWRLPRLKAEHQLRALLSREFAFLLNNWILLGMMGFVLIATTFPLLSEWLRGEEVTVGPAFYNKWMVPLGLILVFLMGVGPLIAWRKATGRKLGRALIAPTVTAVVVGIAHATLGGLVGFPPFVESAELYDTTTGAILAKINGFAPLFSTTLSGFVTATIVQEFWRGTAARRRTSGESVGQAFVHLVSRARRRYGGYIVHLGIVCMYIGFTGAAYDVEKEAALRPGSVMTLKGHSLRYERPRMEADPAKRMVLTDLTLLDEQNQAKATVSPAKFIYRTHPEQPTTEVAIRSRPSEDLYVIMSTVDPETKRATFRVIVRPLVFWIWLGGMILILGTLLAVSPSARDLSAVRSARSRSWGLPMRGAAASILLLGLLAGFPSATASAQESSSLHAGSVAVKNAEERKLFSRTLCQCGSCPRLPLDTCACGWASDQRASFRAALSEGQSVETLIEQYRETHGPKAIAVPADKGLDRALWAVPIAGLLLSVGGIVWLGRRWKGKREQDAPESGPSADSQDASDYDAALDDELRRLEDA